MRNGEAIAGLVLSVAMSAVVSAQEKGGATLTPQDYAEIRELYSRFAWGLDTGADNGMAYARTRTRTNRVRSGPDGGSCTPAPRAQGAPSPPVPARALRL